MALRSYEFCPNYWGLWPFDPTRSSSLCLGPMGYLCSRSCGCPEEAPGETPELIFLSLFCICCVKHSHGDLLPFAQIGTSCDPCPLHLVSQLPSGAGGKATATWGGGGMQRHTPKSFITYPNPPKLMTQGQDSEGSPRTPIFSGHPALPIPGWGSQTTGWFLGHSDLFKMFVQWWYPSMLKNLKSIVVIIIKQYYGQCN